MGPNFAPNFVCRLKTLVWALTELMLSGEAGEPKVRGL